MAARGQAAINAPVSELN